MAISNHPNATPTLWSDARSIARDGYNPKNMNNQQTIVRIGKHHQTVGAARDYLVTVYKALKSGDLYALVLRVNVAQSIDWVRANVDEIVAVGIKDDAVAKNPALPVVALNVALA
jgi:hypothetical protein